MPKKHSEVKSKETPTGIVKIRNARADRPLSFQIPGKSVRLGPGESATIPRDCLITHELKCLCSSGLIVVEDPAAKETQKRMSAVATTESTRETGKAPASEAREGKVTASKWRSSVTSPPTRSKSPAAKDDLGGTKGRRK